jgi:hypothetical protein
MDAEEDEEATVSSKQWKPTWRKRRATGHSMAPSC